MKPRILLVPDWLQWITGTEAKAISAFHPQLDCDVVPAASLREATRRGWKPEKEFEVAHLLTTEVTREFGQRFIGTIPTVTTMHHVHEEREVAIDTSGDAIMTVSSYWEEEMVKRGVPRDKMIRLANGVDVEAFRPASSAEKKKRRVSLGIHPNEVAVGFVGKKGSDNFGRKGFDIFCEGIQRLSEMGIPCVPLVLGSGWQEELEKLLPKKIRRIHLSHTKNPAEVYQAMDYYWVCSRIEGGPVPLLEAMASGVPCVCGDVGMVRDVITDGKNGFILSPANPEAFASKTAETCKNQGLMEQVSRDGRTEIIKRFQWSTTVQAAPRLYRMACHNFGIRTGDPRSRKLNFREAPSGSNEQRITSASIMRSLPKAMRRNCRFQDDVQMMNELFRVRNKRRAVNLALGLALRYPEKAFLLCGEILLNVWIRPTRMLLGRWKQKLYQCVLNP